MLLSLRKQDDKWNVLYILGVSWTTPIRLYSSLDIRLTPFKLWSEQLRPGASEHWNSKDSIYQWAFPFMCRIQCALISFLQNTSSLKAFLSLARGLGEGSTHMLWFCLGSCCVHCNPRQFPFSAGMWQSPWPRFPPALRAAWTSTFFTGR